MGAAMPYVKLWTSLRHKKWFLELRAAGRGVITQLYMIAKETGDTGDVFFANPQQFAQEMGCHRDSLARIVADTQRAGQITYEKSESGVIHIHLIDYVAFQELDEKTYRKNERDKMRKRCGNASNPHPLRAEQKEQSKAEQGEEPPSVVENEPPDLKLPSDRYNWWLVNNPNFINSIIDKCELSRTATDRYKRESLAWIVQKENDSRPSERRKAEKKDWGSFFRNWVMKQREYDLRPKNTLTSEDEQEHYAAHRTRQDNTFDEIFGGNS